MARLILLVKYKTKAGTREKFVSEVSSSGVLQKIREEDGSLSYQYYYDAEDPDTLLLVEEWQSEEQQKIHMQTAHMNVLKGIKEKYVLETSVQKIAY